MATVDEIRKIRIEKYKTLQRAGFSAYPAQTKRTHTIQEATKGFTGLSRSKKEIILVGRIRSLREHGGSSFLHFEDGSARASTELSRMSSPQGGNGKIQAYFKKNRLGEKKYQFFLDNFDIGDFVEIRGILFKTKRGEKTIEASGYKMLTKTLLPLPEKWHGLKDIEERYRKRYLDLLFNSEVKEKFVLRSRIIKEIRSFLDEKGFLEVETPVLQPIYGGTKAKPFKTHINALDMDLYLRVAHELYLKRLLVGGFEKVYEIGRMFRNEGMDKFHNPEFTMLDSYWAYADYKDMMKMAENLFKNLLKKIFGKLEIVYSPPHQNFGVGAGAKKINFKAPWQRLEFNQLIRKYTKINLEEINEKALAKKAMALGIKLEKGIGKAEIADEIYKKFCRAKIWQPTFVIHHPLGSFPLAKELEPSGRIRNETAGGKKLANFQLIVAGFETGLCFSELNNPLEQRKRFEEQEKMFKKGFEEAQRIDKDFLEALEYGMPPAAGFAIGIDRLTALLTNSHSLREVILFPTMRPKK